MCCKGIKGPYVGTYGLAGVQGPICDGAKGRPSKPWVIILNGPAGCGKDTIADRLTAHGFSKASFKRRMFDIAKGMTGLSDEEFMAIYNDRTLKEAQMDAFGYISPRELMIHISEDIMKPLYGNDIFGQDVALQAKKTYIEMCQHTVVADGGFIEEAQAVHDSGCNVLVIRLHRDGFTFKGDSRTYINPDFCESTDYKLLDGQIDKAVSTILNIIERETTQ